MPNWLVFILVFSLVVVLFKRVFIVEDPVKKYIKKQYDPKSVHIHYSNLDGIRSNARFHAMNINIVGAKKLQDFAFYRPQKRFEEELEILSKAIIEIVTNEGRLNFERLEFMITSNTSGWNPNGPRTKLYIYEVPVNN